VKLTLPFSIFLTTLISASSVPAWAATAVDVSFSNSQNTKITAKMYRPTWDGSRPAVVLMHGCAGIFSFSDPGKGVAKLYLEWAQRLTAAGYIALVVDSFTPRGTAQNQCGNGTAGVSEVSDRPVDAYAARKYLSGLPNVDTRRVAILGWSHGASSVLATLSNTHTVTESPNNLFRGGIAFYPGCGLYNAFGGISGSTYVPYAPLIIMEGTEDDLFKSGFCRARIDNAKRLGAGSVTGNAVTGIVYSGAKHSFDNARPGDVNFTAYDLNAKSAGDQETMVQLAEMFK